MAIMLKKSMNEIIKEIADKYPQNAWLQSKLLELEKEIFDINKDRTRLVVELSKAKTLINRLRAGLE